MNDAGEIAVLFFLYGGGFAAALVSMLLATRQRQRVRQVLRYSFVAVLFLVGQAGCWHIATGIGRATGGSGGLAAVKPYTYAVLRAVPRVDRGEYVNIGIVLYCQAYEFLRAAIAVDDIRLRALDHDVPLEIFGSGATS